LSFSAGAGDEVGVLRAEEAVESRLLDALLWSLVVLGAEERDE